MTTGIVEATPVKKPLFVLRGITKSFPGALANDHIDLDIYTSEIHALLGENGAGKSTLMKLLYGFYRADSGQILFNDRPVSIQSPHDALNLKIGMVFQDFSLIPAFTVLENIALFLNDLKPIVQYKQISERIERLSEKYGLGIRPGAFVAQLSIGEQQKVEILKLLLSEAKLLILDEPTRVLAPHEVDSLFRILDNLRADGYAVILITHKMKEVLECSDRITVLRGGRVAGCLIRSEASESKLVELMFGKSLSEIVADRKEIFNPASIPVLELQNVSCQGEDIATHLSNISFEIHPGEIVGVAGVSGNGQKELGDLVLGMTKCDRGKKFIFGKDCTSQTIREIRRNGVSFIPENPLNMAIVPFMTVLENMALTNTGQYSHWGGLKVDWKAVKTDTETSMKRMGFTFSLFIPAISLSGGNLQRMVIVREMTHDPRLIVASYLTRGLDVQSTIAARQALIQARDGQAGVLLISEDLEELFALCDRLIVLFEGRIAGLFKPEETTMYEIGRLMTGSRV